MGSTGCDLRVDLHVQVDVFGNQLLLVRRVHDVDERLHVHLGLLRGLRLGADVGYEEAVAAHDRRQELVREHPLGVHRVDRVLWPASTGQKRLAPRGGRPGRTPTGWR